MFFWLWLRWILHEDQSDKVHYIRTLRSTYSTSMKASFLYWNNLKYVQMYSDVPGPSLVMYSLAPETQKRSCKYSKVIPIIHRVQCRKLQLQQQLRLFNTLWKSLTHHSGRFLVSSVGSWFCQLADTDYVAYLMNCHLILQNIALLPKQ